MEPSIKEQLFRAVFRFRRLSINLPQDMEIRMNEFFLLKGISGHAPCPDEKFNLSDIHSHLHITKPAVSQMLNALEKKGYIRREIDKEDRRKISIVLTPRGQETLSQTKKYMDDMMDSTISRFGEENAKQLIALLNQLADVTESISQELSSNS